MKVDCLQEKIERNLDLKLEILLLDEKWYSKKEIGKTITFFTEKKQFNDGLIELKCFLQVPNSKDIKPMTLFFLSATFGMNAQQKSN
jgi:hypothetical protein